MSLNLDKSTWRRVRLGDVVQNCNETIKDPVAILARKPNRSRLLSANAWPAMPTSQCSSHWVNA
jgi:hypothetical protein